MEGKPLDAGVRILESMSKEELIAIIKDDAKNWLAHDGLWFQAVEKVHGMEAAMDADRDAWEKFTVSAATVLVIGVQSAGVSHHIVAIGKTNWLRRRLAAMRSGAYACFEGVTEPLAGGCGYGIIASLILSP